MLATYCDSKIGMDTLEETLFETGIGNTFHNDNAGRSQLHAIFVLMNIFVTHPDAT